ncbi:hypothetical protein PLESTF_001935700 [Pleodorina starrii]|nr:hypothetical protein PLESTF_001935600 [Pleodorina starrii]GLC77434.1 hypothetical protein PLESTF_001935700 [Pleodorina starrii]
MAATANAPPSLEPPSPSPPSPPEAGGRRLLWLGARREPCCGHEAEGERIRHGHGFRLAAPTSGWKPHPFRPPCLISTALDEPIEAGAPAAVLQTAAGDGA